MNRRHLAMGGVVGLAALIGYSLATVVKGPPIPGSVYDGRIISGALQLPQFEEVEVLAVPQGPWAFVLTDLWTTHRLVLKQSLRDGPDREYSGLEPTAAPVTVGVSSSCIDAEVFEKLVEWSTNWLSAQ